MDDSMMFSSAPGCPWFQHGNSPAGPAGAMRWRV